MPRGNWFDDNRQRTWPFVRGTAGDGVPDTGPPDSLRRLPDAWIVDCGFLPGPVAGFDAAVDSIRLHSVRRTGDVVRFEFRSDAAALFAHPLVFTRRIDDPDYAYESVVADVSAAGESASASGSGGDDCREPLWSGWLVTGRMSDVAARLASGEEVTGAVDEALVEPAVVIDLGLCVVESVAAHNGDRTRIVADVECPELVWPHPVDVVFTAAECLRGDLRLEEGYNCRISQDAAENRLTIGAGVGAGAGEPCGEVPLFDGESPPAGSSLLSGGVSCAETVRSVNGLGGPVLQLLTGMGVVVVQDPENHRVIVDVNMSGLNYCAPEESVESVSLSGSESLLP